MKLPEKQNNIMNLQFNNKIMTSISFRYSSYFILIN